MRTQVLGRRRRHNPLRRRSDVIEGWTLLAVAVLLLLGAPLAGAVAGWWAHDEARATAAAQRADRHRVRAEVGGRADAPLPSVQNTERKHRATVRWTAPDGTPRTSTAMVPVGTHPGERVDVWLDSSGRSVQPPPGEAAIWQHTVTIGACAAVGTGGLILLAHTTVRRLLDRQRLAEWDRAWARTEPEWSRREA
ncbi:Rv1733c family protein [Streptomyces sp. NPDC003635]